MKECVFGFCVWTKKWLFQFAMHDVQFFIWCANLIVNNRLKSLLMFIFCLFKWFTEWRSLHLYLWMKTKSGTTLNNTVQTKNKISHQIKKLWILNHAAEISLKNRPPPFTFCLLYVPVWLAPVRSRDISHFYVESICRK